MDILSVQMADKWSLKSKVRNHGLTIGEGYFKHFYLKKYVFYFFRAVLELFRKSLGIFMVLKLPFDQFAAPTIANWSPKSNFLNETLCLWYLIKSNWPIWGPKKALSGLFEICLEVVWNDLSDAVKGDFFFIYSSTCAGI